MTAEIAHVSEMAMRPAVAQPDTAAADDGFEAAMQHRRKVAEEAARQRVRDDAARLLRREQRGDALPVRPVILADFLAVPDSSVQFRVDGLLPVGGRVVLAAQFKAGKSTLVGNLARSLADGAPFLGRFVVTPPRGRVVIIDAELDQRTLRRWLRDQDIAAPKRVSVVPLRGRVASFDLLDRDIRREWAKLLREHQADVVILDCLRPCLDSLGLSEDKDAGRFLVAFDALLAEAGAGEAVVVHHAGHNGERSRGDSRLRDWPDVEWRLLREASEDGEVDPNARRYFAAYGRDVDVAEGLLRYEPDTRWLALAGGSRKDTAADAVIADVLALLADEPGLSGRAIEGALRGRHGRDRIRSALSRGVADGRIDTARGPKNSTLHLAPTPAVRECAGSAP